jgi:hypothetical protein
MGNCGLRGGLGGAVGEDSSHPRPPPPPPNQIITGNSSTPINAYLFLAINGRGTSSGGGGTGDGSSGARGMRAAVCSSSGVGAAASSVHVCSRRQQRTGARLQWMAGSQHACGHGQRMRCACNSVQASGVCATVCSGGGVCVAVGGSSQQHDCNGRE